MKKAIFLSLFFLALQCSAFSADDKTQVYVIEKPDGSVRIFKFTPQAGDSIDDALKSLGVTEKDTVRSINQQDLPEDQSDRDFWKMNRGEGNKIVVDEKAKQEVAVKANAMNEEITNFKKKLNGLGLTDDDIKILTSSEFKKDSAKAGDDNGVS